MALTQPEILTRQQGESWAVSHARRLGSLIQAIAGDIPYDREVIHWAVWLHDWGSFPRYRLPGFEHAQRSRQVAESEVLANSPLNEVQREKVLEAIEYHDHRDPRPAPSTEALLLREADGLDLLGAVGMAREFAWGPNDLGRVVERIRGRMQSLRGKFLLPAAQAIAQRRMAEMEAFLAALQEESEGNL